MVLMFVPVHMPVCPSEKLAVGVGNMIKSNDTTSEHPLSSVMV